MYTRFIKQISCLAIFLLLMAGIPSGAASGTSSIDLEKMNKDLAKAIEKEFGDNFPYDPEIISFDKIATVDETDHMSKYLMKIRVADGDYGVRSVTVYMRDDLGKDEFKGFTGIFAGQSLSGKGGYYEADYSVIEGARQGFVVASIDRGEVEIPMDADADSILEDQGVSQTLADYFVEIASCHLIISDVLKISVEEIDTTIIGHSLGGTFLALYGSSDYQDIPIGHINNAVFVDIIINYDDEYADLELGQKDNFARLQEKYNSGTRAADGMKTSIFLAQQVENGVPGAHEAFDAAISQTYYFKQLMGEKPYTPDYYYWPADCDTDSLVDMILGIDRDLSIVNPYSSLESDWYMTGIMAGEIPIGNLRNFDDVLYIGFDGGFGFYGEDWFKDQGAEIYYGGDSGHGFMYNDDSSSNWAYIWSYSNDHSLQN